MNEVFNLLIHTSVVASILIILIFILRFIFKNKINTRLQYALWLIVAVRLLIPINFQLFLEVKSTFPISNETKAFDSSKSQGNINIFNQSYSNSKYFYQPSNSSTIQNQPRIVNNRSSSFFLSLSDILIIVWITGVVCMLVTFTKRNICFIKKVKNSIKPYNFSDNSYNDAVKLVGLKHKIPVYLSHSLTSPCIIGIFNPVIVLTESIIRNTEATKFALIHEMIHYKQKDNFFRLLGNILCSLYWFNPLVWLSVETAKNDAELSCDSKVLQKISSKQYINYCFTLVSIAGSSNQVMTAMSTGGRKMKKRIDMILKSPQNWTITIVAVIICISFGAASFINVRVKAQNLNKPELLTEKSIKEIGPKVASLGNIHDIYRLLTSLPNPNDNYKINMIIINNTNECRNTYCLEKSLYLTYELSKNNSSTGLSDDDVHRINKNALRMFSNIPDLKAITISYIDKPANSLIRNEKAPIDFRYLRSEIEMQNNNLSVAEDNIESLKITPKIDHRFSQSLGNNNVLIVFGYSEFYSSIGISEQDYNKKQEISSKVFSKLGSYSNCWESNGSTIYRFSPNPVYSDWSDFMITTDKYGNLESHGIILSDFN